MLLVKDSLVQIYYYTSNENNDFVGIVVIPENIKENDGKNLLVIKKDGQITYISSDIAPIENYLVISRNERSDWANSALINSPSKVQMRESSTGKYLKITKAKFTSIGAKRTVESWWAGEPEVRLNVIYPYVNNITNKVDEMKFTTFLYPEKWIKNGVFKNDVKWNSSLIECAYWYANEHPYGRRLIWTEEDGTSSKKTITSNVADKGTGITNSLTTEIPATNKDVVFADNWIDYYNTPAGIVTWGIIQFEIKFE